MRKERQPLACALNIPLISLYPSDELVKGVQPVVSPKVKVCILQDRSKGT
jgi:hypothetical protein